MSERCNVCHLGIESHEDALLCCPSCGGAATFDLWYDQNSWVAICKNSVCGVAVGDDGDPNREEAAARWNRRASPWIAIADRWPDAGPPILIRFRNGQIDFCRNGIGEPSVAGNNIKEVAEWMAIPE